MGRDETEARLERAIASERRYRARRLEAARAVVDMNHPASPDYDERHAVSVTVRHDGFVVETFGGELD